MEYKLNEITLKTVNHNDINEVARMWELNDRGISHEEAGRTINWMLENHKQNQLHRIYHICFAIFYNETNRIIGWCGLDGRSSDNDNKLHIFYMIDKEYRRRCYATESAKKLLEYGFRNMEVDKIDGGCAKENIGSKKILEKIGMKRMDDNEDGSLQYIMTSKNYFDLYCLY